MTTTITLSPDLRCSRPTVGARAQTGGLDQREERWVGPGYRAIRPKEDGGEREGARKERWIVGRRRLFRIHIEEGEGEGRAPPTFAPVCSPASPCPRPTTERSPSSSPPPGMPPLVPLRPLLPPPSPSKLAVNTPPALPPPAPSLPAASTPRSSSLSLHELTTWLVEQQQSTHDAFPFRPAWEPSSSSTTKKHRPRDTRPLKTRLETLPPRSQTHPHLLTFPFGPDRQRHVFPGSPRGCPSFFLSSGARSFPVTDSLPSYLPPSHPLSVFPPAPPPASSPIKS
ncbi:hypothetical protein OF83DRAFT_822736 [Amylostereum chailletii]|nr:hypothetical protein OF83DRAFT_822736 [Amylostereum chailletii]